LRLLGGEKFAAGELSESQFYFPGNLGLMVMDW